MTRNEKQALLALLEKLVEDYTAKSFDIERSRAVDCANALRDHLAQHDD